MKLFSQLKKEMVLRFRNKNHALARNNFSKIFGIFIFLVMSSGVASAQNFYAPLQATNELKVELAKVQQIVDAYDKNDYPIYHEAYAKREIILEVAAKIKAGQSTSQAYYSSIPDTNTAVVQSIPLIVPNAQGKSTIDWLAAYLLPIISQ